MVKVEKKAFVGAEDALTEKIIGVFYQVFNELGDGFVESVYCRAMAIALAQSGLDVAVKWPCQCHFAVNRWESSAAI